MPQSTPPHGDTTEAFPGSSGAGGYVDAQADRIAELNRKLELLSPRTDRAERFLRSLAYYNLIDPAQTVNRLSWLYAIPLARATYLRPSISDTDAVNIILGIARDTGILRVEEHGRVLSFTDPVYGESLAAEHALRIPGGGWSALFNRHVAFRNDDPHSTRLTGAIAFAVARHGPAERNDALSHFRVQAPELLRRHSASGHRKPRGRLRRRAPALIGVASSVAALGIGTVAAAPAVEAVTAATASTMATGSVVGGQAWELSNDVRIAVGLCAHYPQNPSCAVVLSSLFLAQTVPPWMLAAPTVGQNGTIPSPRAR